MTHSCLYGLHVMICTFCGKHRSVLLNSVTNGSDNIVFCD